MFKSFFKDSSGAVSVEYALIAGLVSIAGLKSVHCITLYCIIPAFNDLANFFQGGPA